MFVQEEKIFAGKVLKIHICTVDGTEWLEEVTEDTTVEKLKEKCLKHVGFGLVCVICPCLLFFFVLSLLRLRWLQSAIPALHTGSVGVTGFVFIVTGQTSLFII